MIAGSCDLHISQELRIGTGRVILAEVLDKSRKTLEALIRKHVKIGSSVWSHASKVCDRTRVPEPDSHNGVLSSALGVDHTTA